MLEIKKRYETLKSEVEKNNRLYYEEDRPVLSDEEYDTLYQELLSLEKKFPELKMKDSPTQKVGGKTKREMKKAEHAKKLLSLENAFSMEDLLAFEKRVRSVFPDAAFSAEQKIDGLSLALTYQKGILLKAVTRGNGVIGEDVTENARNINSIPKYIRYKGDQLIVRGEVCMTFSEFNRVNKNQEEKGKDLFRNPRNCAAGTLRQLDPDLLKERSLGFIAFEVMNKEEVDGLTCREKEIDFLGENFWTTEPIFLKNIGEIAEYMEAVDRRKNSGGNITFHGKTILGSVPTDGLVIKVSSSEMQETLGTTAKYPKWAIAYKFQPEVEETVVRNIVLQVGRSGRITPVAIVDPVELSGSIVSKATLHNQGQIDALDLRIGDTVKIQKAGEIIPEILSVCQEKPRGERRFLIGDHCPDCGGEIDKSMADYKCVNPACSSRKLQSLIFFAGKTGMDIQALGEKLIASLYEKGYVQSVSDFYRLHEKKEELIEQKILGLERNTQKILDQIEKSKNNDFGILLRSLGIPGIGSQVTKILSQLFKTAEELQTAEKIDFLVLDGIGDVLAENLFSFFQKKENIDLLEELKGLGLSMEMRSEKESSTDVLKGLSFVITGTLSQPRPHFEKIIKENGGEVKSSVSKKTNYLLAGEEAGSKLEKAKELGIKILDEAAFKGLLG